MEPLTWDRAMAAVVLLAFATWVAVRLRATPTARGERRTVGALVDGLVARWPTLGAAWAPVRSRLAPFLPRSLADVGLLVGLCAVLVSAWIGIDLLEDVVTEDEIVALDATIDRELLARRSPVLVGAAEWISEVSAPWAVVFVTAWVGGALVLLRRRAEALGLFAAVAGTGVLTTVLKVLVGRARPLGEAIYEPLGDAFPSGHTSGTAALGVFLVWLLTRRSSWRTQLRAAVAVTGVTSLVAASRVYLSVHWLSDVLGGAALGFGWSVACILWTRRTLQPTSGDP